MSRRRRALLLLGLALLLGALAASDVGRREAALRGQLAPLADVLVARRAVAAGHRLREPDLAMRRVPSRFAPAGAATAPELVVGQRLAVSVPQGAPLAPYLLERLAPPSGAPVRRGERAAEVVALASPEAVLAGARVDVLVTREGGSGGGSTELALEDVEVLSTRGVAGDGGAGARGAAAGPRLAATLRVTPRQAVYLAAAEAFAREIRLLARAPGDRARTGGLAIGAQLR